MGGRRYSSIYYGACVTMLLSEVFYLDNNSVCAEFRRGHTQPLSLSSQSKWGMGGMGETDISQDVM